MDLVAQAVRLESAEVDRQSLSILVLAKFSRQEIAAILQLDERVIEAWELLFFDARPLLKHRGWINNRIILPLEEYDPVQAEHLRLAYHGGPVVALEILKYIRGSAPDDKISPAPGEVAAAINAAFVAARKNPRAMIKLFKVNLKLAEIDAKRSRAAEADAERDLVLDEEVRKMMTAFASAAREKQDHSTTHTTPRQPIPCDG